MEPGELRKLTVEDDLIDEFYTNSQVPLMIDGPVNQYVVMTGQCNPKKSAVGRYRNGKVVRFPGKPVVSGLSPRDTHQLTLLDALQDDQILCQGILGRAGTGKTTLALAWALEQLQQHDRAIYMTKPATYVGSARAFGPVPGTAAEKYAPFLDSYKIVLQELLGDHSKQYIEQLIEKEQFKFIPIEFARGCTYKHCTMIIDEAQNTTWHELSTVVSRVGDDSKVILMGDLQQIDIRLPAEKTGLWQFLHSKVFSSSQIACCVGLQQQYRSKITELVTEATIEIGTHETEASYSGRPGRAPDRD